MPLLNTGFLGELYVIRNGIIIKEADFMWVTVIFLNLPLWEAV